MHCYDSHDFYRSETIFCLKTVKYEIDYGVGEHIYFKTWAVMFGNIGKLLYNYANRPE